MLDAETLRRIGLALYGEACWQSELGRALGIDSRRIRAFLYSERSIPPGVWPELADLMRARGGELLRLADQLDRNDCRIGEFDILPGLKAGASRAFR